MSVANSKDALRWENTLLESFQDALRRFRPSMGLQAEIHRGWDNGLQSRIDANTDLVNYTDDEFKEALEEEILVLEALRKVTKIVRGRAAQAWKKHFEDDIRLLEELLK